MLFEYLQYDMAPYLRNPRMRQRIDYLHETNLIPLSYEQIVAYGSDPAARTALISGLPPGDSRAQDLPAHASEKRARL